MQNNNGSPVANFVQKTFEILKVKIIPLRSKTIAGLYNGCPMERSSLLGIAKLLRERYCRSISGIGMLIASLGRYGFCYLVEYVWIS